MLGKKLRNVIRRWRSRLTGPPDLRRQAGEQRHNADKPTLLVVSPGASAGGAPVLAQTLCQAYAASHNLVVLLVGEGELQPAFQQASCAVLGPAQGPIDATSLRRALAALPGQPWPELALVASIDSRGVLAALFASAIPSLALIDELPCHTRPQHASTEVFIWADLVIFPSELTYRENLAAGAPGGAPPVSVLPPELDRLECYGNKLLNLGASAAARRQAEAPQLAAIAAAGLIDADFVGGGHLGDPQLLAGLYLRQWQRRIGPRLPFPGFHPDIYQEHSGCDAGEGLCHWLAAGRPAGPWSVPVIRCPEPPPAPTDLSVGLHLHVFYPELLPELLHRLSQNHQRPQLILTLPEGVNRALVEQALAEAGDHGAELHSIPNLGRDIGPLLVELGRELESRFEIYGHLHTKRSELVDGGVARRWRTFLLANLLGEAGRPMLDAILAAFAADPQLGLVFPEDPNALGWSANQPFAEALAPRLGLPLPLPQALRFPVGTMFWARRGALSPLYGLKLQWADLPPEPVGYDGSLLHAVERLLPLVAQQAGFGLATTHVPGVTR